MGWHTAQTSGAVERENVRINRVDFSFVKPRGTWFSVIQSAEWRGEGASAVPTSPTGKHARDPPLPPQPAAEASQGTVLVTAGRLVALVGAGGRGGEGLPARGVPWSEPRGQHRGGGSLSDAARGSHAHVTPAYL